MAKDYIEREAVLSLAKDICVLTKWDTEYHHRSIDPIDVRELPAADVVHVVRCGECVFHEISDYGGGCTKNVCSLWNRQIQDDDYCSYGMRQDGDEA